MISAIFVVVILLFIVVQFYNLQISCLLHTVTESISLFTMTKQYKTLECHLRRQVMRSFCVFLMSLVFFPNQFHWFFSGFFLTDLTLQDKQNIHKLFMGELCLFQIVQ